MDIYKIITILVMLSAIFGYINYRYIKLPGSIGIMILSLLASLIFLAIGNSFPQVFTTTVNIINSIDFELVVLKFMLGFLLFAAGIQVDTKKLQKQRVGIITFATIGVLISTIIVGFLMFWLTSAIGLKVNLLHCLLFGALISPTDPVAVMGILRKSPIDSSLKLRISGESLFNDGMSLVLFITFYELAKIGIDNITLWDIIWLFLRETIGGVLLGIALGRLAYLFLKPLDNYAVEVMGTIAIVMGGYFLAEILHVSGPLAMVIAGIITGNRVMHQVMSDKSKDYIGKFWEMIDALMTAIIFLLIGLEMLVVPLNWTLFFIGCMAVLIVLFARLVSVSIPIFASRRKSTFRANAIPILTWGALRGGVSVALALSVPRFMYGHMFVSITYIVVLFSILVQGLTIKKLAKKM